MEAFLSKLQDVKDSLNFATYDSCFVLVCGMVAGWVCNGLSKECHCNKGQVTVVNGQKMIVLFYSFMLVLIVSIGVCVHYSRT
jgi:hypothetical protein